MGTSKPQPQIRPGEDSEERLDSWKEIAAYLKRDERTVRRWEEEGLPVRRKVHKKQASVYAYRRDIDAWWHEGRRHLEQGDRRGSSKWLAKALAGLGVASFILIVVLNLGGIRSRLRGNVAAARPIGSIAVLPLENLSKDPEEEYFADGMTEELTTQLAQISMLKVISRTSMMRFKGTRTPLSQIAGELHVDAIVQGSVARSGQHVRITAQLIDASTDRHLWAHSYERDLSDVLALQAEVADAIVNEVNGKLTPQPRTRAAPPRPANPEAYVAYLKGRYFLNNRRSDEGARKSLEYSAQAVSMDPDWALAQSGLADSYVSAALLGVLPPKEAMPKAKLTAQKALQLDPNIAEAHVALGNVFTMFDFEYAAGEREFKRAIELSVNNSDAHRAYASYLANVGRADEAISEITLAHRLDPMSFWVSRDVGRVFYESRRYDEALPALREALEMNPNSPVLYNWLSWTYDKKGMIAESVEMDLKDEAAHGTSEESMVKLKKAFETSGYKGYLRKKLEMANGNSYMLGEINARLGNRDEAFRWLEKACDERSLWIAKLKADPELDSLHSDPRFRNLLRRIGLAE
jgi:TolB-like protein/Flp pilus assembly protein TadD